jgi:mono/diheme cytochrome c family protein
MENSLSDKIDQYLDGKMNAAEKAAFEKEISANPELQQQVETQKTLRGGIERANLKANITSTYKKITIKNKITKWGLTTVAVAAIGTAAYFGFNTLHSATSSANYELPALNEEGTSVWADADKNLPTQIFTINPEKDTVLETDGGIVFAVPAGAFLNAKEPLTLEVREALTPTDIMKAGLSTTSDGQLLETGGMFYINARNGETSLKINPAKPVYANVPTKEIKPGMMLFTGERKPDGSINWKNPRKLEKQLTPVDINTLDFYPKGFRAKCAELGFDANNKRVTDSIYYSYAGRRNSMDNYILETFGNDGDENYRTDTIRYIVPDGEKLFEAKCSACHNASNRPSTGPGLQGVLNRIPGGDWKYKYIRNNAQLLASGDAYAKKIFDENHHAQMTVFGNQLTDADIDAILEYANSGGHDPNTLEIDPARVQSIWNEKFQNTIIATKEFEERLQVIFQAGKSEILDLYLNNLDKKMYVIDSLAYSSNFVTDRSYTEFHNFYLRHDGGITIEQPHMKMLQEYFNTQRKAADMAAGKTYKDRMDKNAADDKQHNDIQNQISANDSKREQENFAREYDVNLTEAYRQLGKKRPVYSGGGGGNYYGTSVTTTGWCNVDRYVLEATKNRTTLDYTDPETGKKAVIKYEPFSVTINNENNYEQVKVYLLADSLNSFMRVSKSGTVYSEKLNELFNYSLVVVAQKDKKWFWVQQTDVKPGNISVTLNEIEESQLRVNLDDSFTKRAGENFRDDLDAMIEQHYYTIALQERKKQEETDAAIMPVIFPFYKGMGLPGPQPQFDKRAK